MQILCTDIAVNLKYADKVALAKRLHLLKFENNVLSTYFKSTVISMCNSLKKEGFDNYKNLSDLFSNFE